jgi:transcriptional regulator with XRE-family HTH domain
MARLPKRTPRPQKIEDDKPSSGREPARRFGRLVRERREALGMRQDDVALATGVGRRFIVELEAGKPNCQLGKALLVAEAVGLRPFDLMTETNADNALLPDLADDDGLPP